ncbi:MAG: PorT family protein [Cyclobacteriaceae bacterium]|nr:PorT family protein [Cyclobacteriaceae bacterium]
MKKIFLLMLVGSFSYSLCQAQAQFAIGVKGGPNFAKIDVNSSVGDNYKNRTGFHGGAFALIKLTKIGIQPELLFSQQGSTVKFNSQDLKSNFTYVNVPVMLKLYTVAGINLQVGPQFGFLTTAESEYNPIDDEPQSLADVKNAYKKSDVSAALGVGWDLPFGLTIDARYNLGLSKINDGANSNESKNQVIQVSLGYKLIKIGK